MTLVPVETVYRERTLPRLGFGTATRLRQRKYRLSTKKEPGKLHNTIPKFTHCGVHGHDGFIFAAGLL
jgi:hypothetical protein